MSNITPLMYNGSVKVKRRSVTANPLQPKIVQEDVVSIKEGGTNELFYSLVSFLLGTASSNTPIPKFLDVVQINGAEKQSILTSRLRLDGRIDLTQDYYALFSTTLSKARLSSSATETSTVYFVMYSGNNSDAKPLAYIRYEDFPLNALQNDQDLLIEWRLGFINRAGGDN